MGFFVVGTSGRAFGNIYVIGCETILYRRKEEVMKFLGFRDFIRKQPRVLWLW